MDDVETVIVDGSVVEVVGWSGDVFSWRGEALGHLSDGEPDDLGWREIRGESVDLAGGRRTVTLSREGGATVPADDATWFHALEAGAHRHHASLDGFTFHHAPDAIRARGIAAREPVAPWDDLRASTPAHVTFATCAEVPRTVFSYTPARWSYSFEEQASWARAWPHPTRRWTALVISQEHIRVMQPRLARHGAVVLVATGPETQLLHPADVGSAQLAGLARELSPDFVVTHVGAARAERASSVVYAAAGWEDDAAQLALRLPGGATVEPLTWTAPKACLVVALGRSAEAAWR